MTHPVGTRVRVTDRHISIGGPEKGQPGSYIGQVGTVVAVNTDTNGCPHTVRFDDETVSTGGSWSTDALEVLQPAPLRAEEAERRAEEAEEKLEDLREEVLLAQQALDAFVAESDRRDTLLAEVIEDRERLIALRAYVEEHLLDDGDLDAVAGFTHGYVAGQQS